MNFEAAVKFMSHGLFTAIIVKHRGFKISYLLLEFRCLLFLFTVGYFLSGYGSVFLFINKHRWLLFGYSCLLQTILKPLKICFTNSISNTVLVCFSYEWIWIWVSIQKCLEYVSEILAIVYIWEFPWQMCRTDFRLLPP